MKKLRRGTSSTSATEAKIKSMGAQRAAFFVSFGVLILLTILSVVWYRERMLFVDPAFIAFRIIQGGELAIQEHRYGSFITQLFPLVAYKAGASLQSILLVYSVGFYLFYTAVAAVVGWYWRQYALGTLWVLYLTFVVSDVYFWPNNEIHQAVGYAFLFLGLYWRYWDGKIPVWGHLLLLTAVLLATVTHLLVAASLGFLWVYLHLNAVGGRSSLVRPRIFAYTLLIAGGIFVRYYLSSLSSYDSQKLEGIGGLTIGRVLGTFTSGQADSLWKLMLTNYWLCFPVFFAGAYAAWKRGRLGWWFVMPLALTAYFMLICLTYPNAFDRTYLFYFESEWMGAGLILVTPFVIHGLSHLRRWQAVALIAVVLGVRVGYIVRGRQYFATRLANHAVVHQYLDSIPTKKGAIIAPNQLSEYFGMDWGVPVESLFYSVLSGKDLQPTLKIGSVESVDTTQEGRFIGNFGNYSTQSLDDSYFKVSDGRYEVIAGQELDELRKELSRLPE